MCGVVMQRPEEVRGRIRCVDHYPAGLQQRSVVDKNKMRHARCLYMMLDIAGGDVYFPRELLRQGMLEKSLVMVNDCCQTTIESI
jgi:hypothetical protein